MQQRQVIRRLIFLVGTITFLQATWVHGQPGGESEKFQSKEGRYSVAFPGKPERKTVNFPTKAGQVTLVVQMANDVKGNVFGVMHGDFPQEYVKESGPRKIADRVFAGIARQSTDQAKETKEIKMGGQTGWECRVPFNAKGLDGTTHNRVFVIGNRVYLVMVMAFNKRAPSQEEIDAFMKSFKIQEAD